MPGDGTRAKVNEWLLAGAAVVTGAADAAVRLSDAASAPPATATVAAPRYRSERRLSCLVVIMTGLPCR
jgi:hypothetical protein